MFTAFRMLMATAGSLLAYRFGVSGQANVIATGVDEIFSLDLRNDFASAPAAGGGNYVGEGVRFSTDTSFTLATAAPTGLNNNVAIDSEDYDSEGTFTLGSNNRWTYSAYDTQGEAEGWKVVVKFSAALTSNISIRLQFPTFTNSADTTGTSNVIQTLMGSVGDTEVSVDNVNFGLNSSSTGQTGVVLYRTAGSITPTISEVIIEISTDSNNLVGESLGPSSYNYTISNDSGTSIATGTYNAPASQSDEDVVVDALRNAIITTANASSNALFTDTWQPGDAAGTLSTINVELASKDSGTGFLGADEWDVRTGDQSGSSQTSISAWSSFEQQVFRARPAGSASGDITLLNTLESATNVGRVTLRSSTNNEATFRVRSTSAHGNDTRIYIGDLVSSSGTPNTSGSMTIVSYNTTTLNPVDIADVNGGWDCRIISIPTLAANDTSVTVFLPISASSNAITINTDHTIEDVVDTIVAASWGSGVAVTKKSGSTDTVRVVGSGVESVGSNASGQSGVGFGITGYGNASATGSLSISHTDIHNSTNTRMATDSTTSSSGYSASPGTSLNDSGGALLPSGSIAARRVFIDTNTDYNFGLTVTTTANSASNAGISLNLGSEAVDGVTTQMATGVSIDTPMVSTTLSSNDSAAQAATAIAALSSNITASTENFSSGTNVTLNNAYSTRDTIGFISTDAWDLRSGTASNSSSVSYSSWSDWDGSSNTRILRIDDGSETELLESRNVNSISLSFSNGATATILVTSIDDAGTDTNVTLGSIFTSSATAPPTSGALTLVSYIYNGAVGTNVLSFSTSSEPTITVTNNHPTNPLTFTAI